MTPIPERIDRLLSKVQKPARYCGGESGSIVKDIDKIDVRVAFCFPDTYEIGMSHLGSKILYGLINSRDNYWCERVFAPDKDFEQILRQSGEKLYALESFDPVDSFDLVGFTLQYELSYTTILNMLNLSGIPIFQKEREGLSGIIMGGGPCACNPEPLADFFDLFQLGEGEELMLDVCDLYARAKSEDWTREQFLCEAAHIKGVYVPSLYDIKYNDDGTIRSVIAKSSAPPVVTKRIVNDLDSMYFPSDFVVPFSETVHDRAMIEVLRGCIRGCRFCQAGYIYRPFREKKPEVLNTQAKSLCNSTGYDEVSLLSLSTSDYSQLENLMDGILSWSEPRRISIALPSLRVDNFSNSLMEKISKVRKSGLTFAPEAGSQRLRNIINKNVTEDELLSACEKAFKGGQTSVKLYFMMGLPYETDDDILAIGDLCRKVVSLFYSLEERPKKNGIQITASVAVFVPKPDTPFEFVPQDKLNEIKRKQDLLIHSINNKKIRVNYHNAEISRIEAILARGDRRLCNVIYDTWKKGANLEGWSENFSMKLWDEMLSVNNLDGDFYASRQRDINEIMPWDHIDFGVKKEFLIREYNLSKEGITSVNCHEGCTGCGANILLGGDCTANC